MHNKVEKQLKKTPLHLYLSSHNPGITRVDLCVESAPRITLSQLCRLSLQTHDSFSYFCGSPSTVILQGGQKLDF